MKPYKAFRFEAALLKKGEVNLNLTAEYIVARDQKEARKKFEKILSGFDKCEVLIITAHPMTE